MAYIANDEDYELLRSRVKTLYSKIELLDSDMNIVDTLEGMTIDGNISIDADSDVRRTYTATIYLDNGRPISVYNESDLMDKYVRVYIGIKSARAEKWYPMGLFVFNHNGYTYSENERSLSISCSDLVSKLNDTLSGQLTGEATIIKEDSVIRNAIIETVKLGGFNKYIIDYWNRVVPYDLEYSTGASIWEILTELRDLYYPFEMYFDDDTFVCKQIPDGYDDPLQMTDDDLKDFVISEQSDIDYASVRNCVEVWGASVSYNYFCSDATYSDGVYTLPAVNAQTTGNKKFSFLATANNPATCYIKIANTVSGAVTNIGPYQLFKGTDPETGEDIPMDANTIQANKYYVVKYDNKSNKFYYMGQQQAHAMVMLMDRKPTDQELEQIKIEENCDNLKVVYTQGDDTDVELYKSPFSIERIGRKNLVLSGGDYENYETDARAMEVCEYEHWRKCRLTDTITLNTLLIPWLDVNQKVSYKAKYLKQDKPTQWIVKKISITLGSGTMSVTMSRFYPFYPFIVQPYL